MRFILRIAALMAVVLVGVGLSAPDRSTPAADTTQPSYAINGLDLHDGTVLQVGGTYYLYGTRYDCGFRWQSTGAWCGFGVSTSTDLVSWSPITSLFNPNANADANNWHSNSTLTWQGVCQYYGCFNPRMIVRADGVPVFWFNAPRDFATTHANAYYAMGCNSLTGPCGRTAGAPYGSTYKPSLWHVAGNGDFSFVRDGNDDYIIGTEPSGYISVEKLDVNRVNGTKAAGSDNVGGLSGVEGPGAFKGSDGKWYMTYSDPMCGYCPGTGVGYSTATSLLGPWTTQAPYGELGGPANGRRQFSTACGGQPRTVVALNGQPYQLIDLWKGTRNESGAGVYLAPLQVRPAVGSVGRLWTTPLQPFQCT